MEEALKKLLRAASKAPMGTESLEGDRGLIALFEESEVGPARLIRIMEGEENVYWSFSLLPGESKPQFYPSELPFLGGELVAMVGRGAAGFQTILP